MRIVFMGTPDFAANILYELKEQHEVVAVYTQPDAVRGRGKQLEPSPVKKVALKAGIPVFEPRRLRDAEELERLRALAPDAICVAAYGKILPQEVLDIPRFGCLNVHASLLPQYRGAAPIERAILNGEREAGVCIMRMEAGLDTGDYCIRRACEIGDMNAERLTGELSDKGACALISALYELEAGSIRWTAQNDAEATYAEKLAKGELNLNPADSASLNLRRVRASSAAHPSRCVIGGKGVTVMDVRLADAGDMPGVAPEQGMVAFAAKRLFLGCADGVLRFFRLNPMARRKWTRLLSQAAFRTLNQAQLYGSRCK